jgi:hypothetical protein
MVKLGLQAGHRPLELAGRSCCFLDLVEFGRLPEADSELFAYAALAEEIRVPRYQWRTLVYRAMRAAIDGRFAEAEALGFAARERAQRFGGQDADSSFALLLMPIRREQVRLGEVEPVLKHLVERFPTIPSWRAALALFHLDLGREAEARAGLEAQLPLLLERPAYDFTRLPALVVLAEVAAVLRAPHQAQILYETLHPYSPRTVMIGAGVVCWCTLDRILGLLAASLADLDRALGHLAAARDAEIRMGARPWLGWTELARSEVLACRGRPGDAAAARSARERAREIAANLGLARLAASAGG